jgi:hypothetical protein
MHYLLFVSNFAGAKSIFTCFGTNMDKHAWYLRTKGYMEYARTELAMDASSEAMDAILNLVMEEIDK